MPVVGDVAHDAQQQHRHGPGEVQRLGRPGQDLVRIAQVRVEIVGRAFGVAGQQRGGVGQDDRVVVHVDDPGFRRDGLGDLVGAVEGGQAGADVEELPDAHLPGQVPHGAAHERAGGAGDDSDVGEGGQELVAGRAVDGVVVLSAEPVVPDPGRVRHGRVELGRVPAARGAVTHGAEPPVHGGADADLPGKCLWPFSAGSVPTGGSGPGGYLSSEAS